MFDLKKSLHACNKHKKKNEIYLKKKSSFIHNYCIQRGIWYLISFLYFTKRIRTKKKNH